jgi:hypothetical protein
MFRHGEKANDGSGMLTQVIANINAGIPNDTVVLDMFEPPYTAAGLAASTNVTTSSATGPGYTSNANGITTLINAVATAADSAGLTAQGAVRASLLESFINTNLGLSDRSYNLFTYSSTAGYGEPEARADYTAQQLKPATRTIWKAADVLSVDGMVAQVLNGPPGIYIIVTKHTSNGATDVANGLISGVVPGPQAGGTGTVLPATGAIVAGTAAATYPIPIPALAMGNAGGYYKVNTNPSTGVVTYTYETTAAGNSGTAHSTKVQTASHTAVSRLVQAAIGAAVPTTTVISATGPSLFSANGTTVNMALGGTTLNQDNTPLDYYTNLSTGVANPLTGTYSIGDITLGPQIFDAFAQANKNFTTAYALDSTPAPPVGPGPQPYLEEIEYPLVWQFLLDQDNIVYSANVNLGYMITSNVSTELQQQGYVNVPGYPTAAANPNNTNNATVNTPAANYTVQNYFAGTTSQVSVNLLSSPSTVTTVNASGDNVITAYVNGVEILTGSNWQQVESVQASLHPGDVIAVSVANAATTSGSTNPAGLLASFNFLNGTIATSSLWQSINAASVAPGLAWTAQSYPAGSSWLPAVQQADNTGTPINSEGTLSPWTTVNNGPLAGIASNAQWIWYENTFNYAPNNTNVAYFRYTLPATIPAPAVLTAAGDNVTTVWINDVVYWSNAPNWQQQEDAQVVLTPGSIIAVSVQNQGGPAGLLASITLSDTHVYGTDVGLGNATPTPTTSWYVANAANVTDPNWQTNGYNDAGAFVPIPSAGYQGNNSGTAGQDGNANVWYAANGGPILNISATAQWIWYEDSTGYPSSDTSVAYFLYTVPSS